MGRIEESAKYAKILFAINEGNKTLSQIADALENSKPTIQQQLAVLKEAGYIVPVERKKKGFSVKWELNKDKLLDYWEKIYSMKYGKYDRDFVLPSFDTWFLLCGQLTKILALHINFIGHFFLIAQAVDKNRSGNVLDITLNDILIGTLAGNERIIAKNKYSL